MSKNSFTGSGNVGRDPDCRIMATGLAVTNFSFAATERYKDKNGEQKEITEWVNVACFGKVAEIASKIKKGDEVVVFGKLKTEKYEKDGRQHSITKVIASEVYRAIKRDNAVKEKHYEDKANGYAQQKDADPFFDDEIRF